MNIARVLAIKFFALGVATFIFLCGCKVNVKKDSAEKDKRVDISTPIGGIHVGKGIDRSDHVAAALAALDGLITERTHFFIENHMLAQEYRDGTLGAKQRRAL